MNIGVLSLVLLSIVTHNKVRTEDQRRRRGQLNVSREVVRECVTQAAPRIMSN